MYIRGRLSPRFISILMNFKSWGYKDKIDIDVEELSEDEDRSSFPSSSLLPHTVVGERIWFSGEEYKSL